MTQKAVEFHRSLAPYEAGDVAGFPAAKADDLVARGIAVYWPKVAPTDAAAASQPPVPTPDVVLELLDAMDRAALVAYGKAHLGLTDEPPATTTDDELRAAIRAVVEPATPPAAAATGKGKKTS